MVWLAKRKSSTTSSADDVSLQPFIQEEPLVVKTRTKPTRKSSNTRREPQTADSKLKQKHASKQQSQKVKSKPESKHSFWGRRPSKQPNRKSEKREATPLPTKSKDVKSRRSSHDESLAPPETIFLGDKWKERSDESPTPTREDQSIFCSDMCGLPFEARECMNGWFPGGGNHDDNECIQEASKGDDPAPPPQSAPSPSASNERNAGNISTDANEMVNESWLPLGRLSGSVFDHFTSLNGGQSDNVMTPSNETGPSTTTTTSPSTETTTPSEPIQTQPASYKSKSSDLSAVEETIERPQSAERSVPQQRARSRQSSSLLGMIPKRRKKGSKAGQSTNQAPLDGDVESREDAASAFFDSFESVDGRDGTEESATRDMEGVWQEDNLYPIITIPNGKLDEREGESLHSENQHTKRKTRFTKSVGRALSRSFRGRKSRKSTTPSVSPTSNDVTEVQASEIEIDDNERRYASQAFLNTPSLQDMNTGAPGAGADRNSALEVAAATVPKMNSNPRSANEDASDAAIEMKGLTYPEATETRDSPTDHSCNRYDDETSLAINASKPSHLEQVHYHGSICGLPVFHLQVSSGATNSQNDGKDAGPLERPLKGSVIKQVDQILSNEIQVDSTAEKGSGGSKEDGKADRLMVCDELLCTRSGGLRDKGSGTDGVSPASLSQQEMEQSGSFSVAEWYNLKDQLTTIQETVASDAMSEDADTMGAPSESFFGMSDQPNEESDKDNDNVLEGGPSNDISDQGFVGGTFTSVLASLGGIFSRKSSPTVTKSEAAPTVTETALEAEPKDGESVYSTVLDPSISTSKTDEQLDAVPAEPEDNCSSSLPPRDPPNEQAPQTRSFVDKISFRNPLKLDSSEDLKEETSIQGDEDLNEIDAVDVGVQVSPPPVVSVTTTYSDVGTYENVPQLAESGLGGGEITEMRPASPLDDILARGTHESTVTSAYETEIEPAPRDSFDANGDTVEIEVGASETLLISPSDRLASIDNNTTENVPPSVKNSFDERVNRTRSLTDRLFSRKSSKSFTNAASFESEDETKNFQESQVVRRIGDLGEDNTDAAIEVEASQALLVSASHFTRDSTANEDASQSKENSCDKGVIKARSFTGRLFARTSSSKSTGRASKQHVDECEASFDSELVERTGDDVSNGATETDVKEAAITMSASRSNIDQRSCDVVQPAVQHVDEETVKTGSLVDSPFVRSSPNESTDTVSRGKDEVENSIGYEMTYQIGDDMTSNAAETGVGAPSTVSAECLIVDQNDEALEPVESSIDGGITKSRSLVSRLFVRSLSNKSTNIVPADESEDLKGGDLVDGPTNVSRDSNEEVAVQLTTSTISQESAKPRVSKIQCFYELDDQVDTTQTRLLSESTDGKSETMPSTDNLVAQSQAPSGSTSSTTPAALLKEGVKKPPLFRLTSDPTSSAVPQCNDTETHLSALPRVPAAAVTFRPPPLHPNRLIVKVGTF